jgi:hypothetical protein
MSSEYEYEYEYRPLSGLSTKSSRACSLLAVPRTRTRTQRSGTRTRWLFRRFQVFQDSQCQA